MPPRRLAGPLLVSAALLAGCGGGTSTSAGTLSNPATPGSSAPAAGPASALASPADSTGATPGASAKHADQPAASAASAPCGSRTTPNAAAGARLPRGFPVVAGWAATGSVTQGSTTAVRGAVIGRPAAIPDIRDRAFARIVAAGYRKTGSDQEPGFEADGDFEGPHAGNINVKTLCRDFLLVTYTITS